MAQGPACETPGRLRPTDDRPGVLEMMSAVESQVESIPESRDVHIPYILDLFNHFTSEHKIQHPHCNNPIATMPPEFEVKFGTGYKEALRCKMCGFHTRRFKLYQEADRQGGATRGPKPTKKAVQMSLALSKLPVGITGARTLLNATETPTQSQSKLQKITNKLSGVVVSEMKESLAQNRAKLRKVQQVQGKTVKDGEAIFTTGALDGAYNNPTRNSYTQNATQCTLPVLESTTGENMLIGFQYASKLCSCRRTGEGKERKNHGPSCQANF